MWCVFFFFFYIRIGGLRRLAQLPSATNGGRIRQQSGVARSATETLLAFERICRHGRTGIVRWVFTSPQNSSVWSGPTLDRIGPSSLNERPSELTLNIFLPPFPVKKKYCVGYFLISFSFHWLSVCNTVSQSDRDGNERLKDNVIDHSHEDANL